MKKFLSVLLAVLLVVAMMPLSAGAVEILASGDCGNPGLSELTWVLDSEGTLTISGTGDMRYMDNVERLPPWYDLRDSINKVILEEGVTSINFFAFVDCTSLVTVELPNSLTRILNFAFEGCSSLVDITIPNSVTYIGSEALRGTPWVAAQGDFFIWKGTLVSYQGTSPDVVIPNTVTSIGEDAFINCSSIVSVTIPESVTSIGWDAFAGCHNLTSVTILNNETDIEYYAFHFTPWLESQGDFFIFNNTLVLYQGSNTVVTVPDGVIKIGDGAFTQDDYSAKVTSITIPDSVTTIGDYAFNFCDSLTDITIPNSVTSIGNHAFQRCSSLTTVTIPDGVTTIENMTFTGCSSLTSVNIPNSVTSIGAAAFNNCPMLKDITIPDNVTSIGSSAFGGCKSLTSVVIPNGVTNIDYDTFYHCDSLTNVTIPNGITSIGDWAFEYCAALTNITIPSSVTSIGNLAFLGCTKLTNVTIPDSVINIGEASFGYTDVIYSDDVASYTKDTGFTITGYTGTAAEKYAKENNIPFIALDEAPKFTDVKTTDWFYTPVQWAVANGVTSGTSATTFSPSNKCTRAHAVTFLWNAKGQPEPKSTKNPFTDVKEGTWYYKAVLWAVENNITSGTSATTFSPNSTCTRGQTVTFFHNFAEKPSVSGSNPFKDVEAGKWYYQPILWAVENGVTAGLGNGNFGPNNTCTRGQIVTFLYNYLGKS